MYCNNNGKAMVSLIEIPRALRDIRLDLIGLNQRLPARDNSDMQMAEVAVNYNSEVLKAKYFTEATYYPDYATATGHSKFLKQRTSFDPLFVWVHLRNCSATTWELFNAESNRECQFTYPPPERVIPETEKSIVLETLPDLYTSESQSLTHGISISIPIDVKLSYALKNDKTTKISISIRKEHWGADTEVSCTGLAPEKYAVDSLFDGATFVALG
ncbi:hypothetical protein EYR41_002683 [Orbilia oligospora]|uniref:Uncharacterized protein n=1 Tax=Orbilia oligospora TaxID=2813651 RepID=A0A8H2HQR2_ORBOL|nr:hypothetical protein TWF128_000448 [Orbilia oligospora]TGJ70650.1 hypothetical protein EYR41_002683 [Orbilia oligospora]